MYNLEKIDSAIESGIVSFPSGLTRDERRAFVANELRKLDTVLGYYGDGTPINPIGYGRMTTCACIFCKDCRIMIRSMGGPGHDARCPRCWEVYETNQSS